MNRDGHPEPGYSLVLVYPVEGNRNSPIFESGLSQVNLHSPISHLATIVSDSNMRQLLH
jgi:hypothetical protein